MKKLKVKKWFRTLLLTVLSIGILSWVHKRQEHTLCKKVTVEIFGQNKNYFIGKEEIKGEILNARGRTLEGDLYKNIDIKKLELQLKNHKFVKTCQIAENLKGEVRIEVWQVKPVARFLRKNSEDYYLDDDGNFFFAEGSKPARVLLVSDHDTGIPDRKKENFSNLFRLIKYINDHPFWCTEIVHLELGGNNEIKMHTQFAGLIIEFGKAVHIEEKFIKLDVLYKKILRQQGWNKYSRVNVAYHHQIICE